MSAVTAQAAFDNARTLLNDDAGAFYTNAVLLPKLVEAFRLLQTKLRVTDGSIMKDENVQNLAANVLVLVLPSNLIEPIILWEKAQGSGNNTYLKMSEYDPLPNVLPTAQLSYWQWDGTAVNLIGSSATRTVKMQFWGSLAEPTGPGSSLVFINAEYYLGPMTAAIMAGSIGEAEIMAQCQTLADDSLDLIIKANRGRMAPGDSPRS